MALSDITDKIKVDAQKEAEAIIAAAQKEAAAIEKEVQREINALKRVHEQSLTDECEENKRRVTLVARQEAKLAYDRMRREAIDEVFARALEKLVCLDEKHYQNLLNRFFAALPEKKGTIYAPQSRETETKAVIKETKRHDAIELTDAFRGGIIARFSDSDYNFTFEKLLQDKKQELELKVANLLFS